MKKKSSSRHHHQYLSDIGPGGRQKYATRHLAALDFLQSISMQNEYLIKEAGFETGNVEHKAERSNEETDNRSNTEPKNTDIISQSRVGGVEDISNPAGGKKLDGRAAPVIGYSDQFRYRMQRYHEQSAVVKKWESATLLIHPSATKEISSSRRDITDELSQVTLLSSRMFFSRSHGYPTCLHSVVAYAPEEEKARLERQAEYTSGAKVYKLPQRDWRGTSYRAFFQDDDSDEDEKEDPSKSVTKERKYLHDPDEVDDVEMIQGKNKQSLKGDALTGPVMSSVILYVNAKDLKNELNLKFRESHPQLPPSLTLSKIRNLKKAALLGCLAIDIEMSTIAIAFICFEHLCLKGVVTKTNRRLSMAVCLVLAIKFNESLSQVSQDAVLEFADRQWSIPKKEIMEAEFGAFMHLNFSLHIPHEHIYVMYSRLLKQMHKTSRVYLGEDRFSEYTKCLMDLIKDKDAGGVSGTNNTADRTS